MREREKITFLPPPTAGLLASFFPSLCTVNQSTPRTSNIEWVYDLIDADTKTWKASFILESFNKED